MNIQNNDNFSLETSELVTEYPRMSEEISTKILKDHAGIDSNIREPLEEPAEERMDTSVSSVGG